MQAIGLIGFLLIGLVQLAAIYNFFSAYWDWNWLVSAIAAFFLAYCPVLGPAAGIYAAIKVWHWPWWWGVLLFFWPYLFILPALFLNRDK